LGVLNRGEGVKNLGSKTKGNSGGQLELKCLTPNEEMLNSPKKLTAWKGTATIPKSAISIRSLEMKGLILLLFLFLGNDIFAQNSELSQFNDYEFTLTNKNYYSENINHSMPPVDASNNKLRGFFFYQV